MDALADVPPKDILCIRILVYHFLGRPARGVILYYFFKGGIIWLSTSNAKMDGITQWLGKFDENGTIRISLYAKTSKELEKKVAAVKTDLDRGTMWMTKQNL